MGRGCAGGGADLPGMEVQGGELPKVGIGHVHVEALRLVDEGPPVRRHVHQLALLDLPHRLVKRLELFRDVQVLPYRILALSHQQTYTSVVGLSQQWLSLLSLEPTYCDFTNSQHLATWALDP